MDEFFYLVLSTPYEYYEVERVKNIEKKGTFFSEAAAFVRRNNNKSIYRYCVWMTVIFSFACRRFYYIFPHIGDFILDMYEFKWKYFIYEKIVIISISNT